MYIKFSEWVGGLDSLGTEGQCFSTGRIRTIGVNLGICINIQSQHPEVKIQSQHPWSTSTVNIQNQNQAVSPHLHMSSNMNDDWSSLNLGICIDMQSERP